MIFLKNVKAQGLLIYKDLIEFPLPQGITAIMGENRSWGAGGNNGAGKTTLLNLVSVALWGRTPEGATKDDLINDESKAYLVELEMGSLTIKRSKTKGKGEKLVVIYEGMVHGSKVSQDKSEPLKETQKKLEEYLGIDFNIFCNSVLLGESSKTIKLLDCEPAERGKLLTSIIPTEIYTRVVELVKVDEKKLERDKDRSEVLLEVCSERLEDLDTKRIELKAKISEASQAQKQHDTWVKREKRKLKNELDRAKITVNKKPLYSMEKLAQDRRELQVIDREHQEVMAETKAVLNNLGEFSTDYSVCPTCRQVIDKKTINKLRKTRLEAEEELIEYKDLLRNVRIELDDIDEAMEECRAEHSVKVKAKAKIGELKRDWAALKEKSAAVEIHHLQARLDEVDYEYDKNERQQRELAKELDKFNKKADYYKELKKMMGPEIRNFVLDRVREKLRVYTKEHLESLVGPTFKIEYPSLTDKGEEKFDIHVYRDGIRKQIKLLSGGEKWRIKVAILLAFRSLLMENSKTRFGFLLIDDSLGKLDEEGIENFYNLLSTGKNLQIPQVLVTIPRADMMRNPDRILTIKRDAQDRIGVS